MADMTKLPTPEEAMEALDHLEGRVIIRGRTHSEDYATLRALVEAYDRKLLEEKEQEHLDKHDPLRHVHPSELRK